MQLRHTKAGVLLASLPNSQSISSHISYGNYKKTPLVIWDKTNEHVLGYIWQREEENMLIDT